VVGSLAVAHRALAFPVEQRLGDAVHETERLGAIEIGRREARQAFKAILALSFDRSLQSKEMARQGVEQHRDVRHTLAGAPLPSAWMVRADVAEAARAVGVVGQSGHELVGEAFDDRVVDAEGAHARRGRAI
jgi:hypothetical protein